MTYEELLKENANLNLIIVVYERGLKEQKYQIKEQNEEIERLSHKLTLNARPTRLGTKTKYYPSYSK